MLSTIKTYAHSVDNQETRFSHLADIYTTNAVNYTVSGDPTVERAVADPIGR